MGLYSVIQRSEPFLPPEAQRTCPRLDKTFSYVLIVLCAYTCMHHSALVTVRGWLPGVLYSPFIVFPRDRTRVHKLDAKRPLGLSSPMGEKQVERALDGRGCLRLRECSSCPVLSQRILEGKRVCVDLESSAQHTVSCSWENHRVWRSQYKRYSWVFGSTPW